MKTEKWVVLCSETIDGEVYTCVVSDEYDSEYEADEVAGDMQIFNPNLEYEVCTVDIAELTITQ